MNRSPLATFERYVTLLLIVLVLSGLFVLRASAQNKDDYQYVYVIRPASLDLLTQPTSDADNAVLGRHVAYLDSLTTKGTILLAGRTQTTDSSTFGIVIFKAETEEAARTIMQNDPAVKKGLFVATLFPFRNAFMAKPADTGQP